MEKVRLLKSKAKKVVYRSRKAPYSDIPETIAELRLWMRENGHAPAGPPYTVFVSSPIVPAELLEWEVHIPVKAEGLEPFPHTETTPGVKEIPDREMMCARHLGFYETLSNTLQGLFGFMFNNGYRLVGPPEELYINEPGSAPASQLETEVRLPVEKRQT